MKMNAKKFKKLNDKSPVVSGAIIGNGGQGSRYTLADGTYCELDLEACKALPDGYPIWDL